MVVYFNYSVMDIYDGYKDDLTYFIEESNGIDYELKPQDFFSELLNTPVDTLYSYGNSNIGFTVGSKSALGLGKVLATTIIRQYGRMSTIQIKVWNRIPKNVLVPIIIHELAHVVGFLSNSTEIDDSDEEIVAEFTTYLLSAKYGMLKDLFNKNGRFLIELIPTLKPTTEKEMILYEKAKERARFMFTDLFENWKLYSFKNI